MHVLVWSMFFNCAACEKDPRNSCDGCQNVDSEVVPLLQVHSSENTVIGSQPAAALFSNLQAQVDADSDGWLTIVWHMLEKLWHWLSGKIPGRTHDKTMTNTSAASKQLMAHPCDGCVGQACCCQDTCGLVTGSNAYQLLVGSIGHSGVLRPLNVVKEVKPGIHVSLHEHAAKTCASAVTITAKLDPNRPCCLYTGPTGYKWAVQGCNSLEGTSSITDIVGKTCDGCPKVKNWCGEMDFPTMFWETASFKWAQLIGNAGAQCGNKVFVLIPEPKEAEHVGLKISVRVELESLTNLQHGPEVHFVTTKKCQEIETEFCSDADFKAIITKLGDKAFCMEEKKETDVEHLKTQTHTRSAFQCH